MYKLNFEWKNKGEISQKCKRRLDLLRLFYGDTATVYEVLEIKKGDKKGYEKKN